MPLKDTKGKKVGSLAAVFIVLGFLFPFYELKANRIADGLSYHLWEGPGGIGLIILLFSMVLLIAGISSFASGLRKIISRYLPALFLTGLIIYLAQLGSSYQEETGALSRLGPSFGLLFFLLGIYVLRFIHKQNSLSNLILLLPLLLLIVFAYLDSFKGYGLVKEWNNQKSRFFQETANHFYLSFTATLTAGMIGIPLATWSYNRKRIRLFLLSFLNISQTIPSLALFGLMILPLSALGRAVPLLRAMGVRGIGNTPALIALTLYALFPILRNTYAGYSQVSPDLVNTARGMGMTSREIWTKVKIPMASPVLLNGLRIALIQSLGNATLAKLVGGGGLGVFVFEGLNQSSTDMVLLGVAAILGITVAADRLTVFIITWVTPKGLKQKV